ncbi:MAG TPA: TolC family protein [Candidatus Acidoferrum sp.]|nr:TolC family protein [Candidatus Acidoferrum sp.]
MATTAFVIAISAVISFSASAEDSDGSAARQDAAGSDRLRALVDEALARSPLVLAARSHWQAQTKVPIQASTLPDPELSLQHFTVGSPQPFSGYETSDFYYTGFGASQDIPGPGKLRLQASEAEKDADYARHRYEVAQREVEEKVKEIYFELFYHAKTLEVLRGSSRPLLEPIFTLLGASQDIPGPGKLRLQASEAEKDADYARHRYEVAQREVEEKVKEIYFELFYHVKTLEVLDLNQDELKLIQQIADDRYRLGLGQQQDVIKAQLQTTEILKEHAMHHQEEDQEQFALKQVLGRDPDSRNLEIGEVEPTRLQLDSSQLTQLAGIGSPSLAADRAMEARSAEALKLAHQGYWPDFTVGYTYEKTGPGFRDYYVLNLGAKVPLYFWRKQTPAIEQAALEAESAREQTRATQLQVSSDAESSLVAMRTAERIMSIYRDGLIPQAETSKASALSAYRVGKVDFQTLLSSVLDLQNLRQEYYRSLADHEIAIAKLQQVIGDRR